jgi:competence protein ComEA
MEPAPDEVHRPVPRVAVVEQVVDRLRWFGLGRLVVAAVSVVTVALGAAWLVRAPELPVEASLPVATVTAVTSTSAPSSTTPADGAPMADLVVHVAGAVLNPGVHRLSVGARVIDAVTAAGGPLPDASIDAINLAAPLVDGLRLYVPRVGEVVDVVEPEAAAPTGSGAPAGPVDLNRATVAELDRLPGVGPATAAAIVEHRERAGPFATVGDLEDVPGIGPAKLAALAGLVTV